MVAVYRWNAPDLLLICAEADVPRLAPGGRRDYMIVHLPPKESLSRLVSGTVCRPFAAES